MPINFGDSKISNISFGNGAIAKVYFNNNVVFRKKFYIKDKMKVSVTGFDRAYFTYKIKLNKTKKYKVRVESVVKLDIGANDKNINHPNIDFINNSEGYKYRYSKWFEYYWTPEFDIDELTATITEKFIKENGIEKVIPTIQIREV